MLKLDHLVVAARSLTQGAAFIADRLGVEIPPGGEHPDMGTHNLLMALGDEVYFEVIAINPAAPPPNRPRWYDLDDPMMRSAVTQQPRLINWVVNCDDIANLASRIDIGTPTRLTRGALAWEFALSDDGQMPGGGLLPQVIQWHSAHPAPLLTDLGCRLTSLTLHHNRPDWLRDRLAAMGADHLVTIASLPDTESPFLSATIETPSGNTITLDSRP